MRNNLYPIFIHAILAFFGGCVRELSIINNKGFNLFKFVSGAFISTFCGVVTFFLCMNYDVSYWLTAALTSLAGYIGLPLLDILVSIFKRKFEPYLKIDDKQNKE